MADNQEPVILELAPLPREQVGPFLLLGVSKTADQEEIEANWAQRIIWARKKQLRIPLEDVNWARETINSPEKRVRADITSLNADTGERILQQLASRLGGKKAGRPAWQLLDREKALADYSAPTEVPDYRQVRSTITAPDVPQDVPAVLRLLEELAGEPLDPWSLTLSADSNRGAAE
jgi:hypothetical protein